MPIQNYLRTLPLSHVPIQHPAIFHDDGNGAFTYEIAGTGDSYAASYEAEAALVGAKGIRLHTRTIEQAENDEIRITRLHHLPPTKLLRLQLSFAHVVYPPFSHFDVQLVWYYGTTRLIGGLRFDQTDGTVYYITGNDAWTLLPDITYMKWNRYWNTLDLSINLETARYSHLLLNENALDLSALTVASTGTGLPKHSLTELSLTTLSALTSFLYVDQILLTPETL